MNIFNKDYFLYKRGAYSQEGCDHAIRFFEKRVDLHREGISGVELNHQWKKSTEIFLQRNEYTLFEDLLQSSIKEYNRKYPSAGSLCPWDLYSTFKIQKYKPEEGYFIEHCEVMNRMDVYRILAWMIYLNDVTDGGYTVFPSQNRKFQPRRGDLLIWPAYFTHPHYGVTSKTQTKYILTGWCNFK